MSDLPFRVLKPDHIYVFGDDEPMGETIEKFRRMFPDDVFMISGCLRCDAPIVSAWPTGECSRLPPVLVLVCPDCRDEWRRRYGLHDPCEDN